MMIKLKNAALFSKIWIKADVVIDHVLEFVV